MLGTDRGLLRLAVTVEKSSAAARRPIVAAGSPTTRRARQRRGEQGSTSPGERTSRPGDSRGRPRNCFHVTAGLPVRRSTRYDLSGPGRVGTGASLPGVRRPGSTRRSTPMTTGLEPVSRTMRLADPAGPRLIARGPLPVAPSRMPSGPDARRSGVGNGSRNRAVPRVRPGGELARLDGPAASPADEPCSRSRTLFLSDIVPCSRSGGRRRPVWEIAGRNPPVEVERHPADVDVLVATRSSITRPVISNTRQSPRSVEE